MEFESEGDPRVHFLINLVLSAGFVYVFMTGLELVSSFEFTLLRFVLGTVILVALTNTLI
jgi:hypothetical protein